MRFETFDSVGIERLGAAGYAERSVVHMATGAAGNLADLARCQIAMVLAVEFSQGRECDVIDIEVQTHTDGVGRDDEFHVAGLIERDLGIARARRQRSEHHGGAAALAADQLGEGVNFLRGERDDRRTGGQARDFFLARVRQLRQARTGDEIRTRDQIGNRLAHRLRAKQQRFGASTCVQQAIREDVAALGIARKLDFVDRQEVDVDIARHRFDGRDPIAGALGFDFFLARDEGDVLDAGARFDLVIDLARKQTQRQADHAAVVAKHALDREMRLAGIGRSEHRSDVANAGLEITYHVVPDSDQTLALQSRAVRSRGYCVLSPEPRSSALVNRTGPAGEFTA